ncbi:extracellular catalytic domain type 1 short-chain-length polyhydroxyalkanoate depolymerase [Actinoplanes campanulatus]|uniref:extracellular catalytic domain type 1 short-chain-length polyhydroxyalkanoate depolymerase n=1 Tax=Actinoplanes campanulatus TaxID=113559 RepID=UPI0019547872|nr:PHB depolymerase family esterase [Actinoplanes capillaceus]
MNPRRSGSVLLAAVLTVAGFALSPFSPVSPANAAATLTQVGSFGSNPGALRMYSYVPTGLPAGRPLVVALHGCTQSAQDYYGHSGWPKYADLYRVAVVFPEQTPSNNALSCFNWFTAGDIGRGRGEALSIKQMVDHAIAAYGSDPGRVYVTGLSAGGAMTAVMLAAYPDVFAGGAVVAGLPYNCGTVCQYQAQSKTPKQWGDLVRAAHPGYTGRWPRVGIWYGTADTTVVPANATELRDQWTNVWGVPRTATSTATLPGSTTVEYYQDAVALYRVQGIGHGTPVAPGNAEDQCGTTGSYYLASICSSYHIARSWGLPGGTMPPSPTPSVSTSPSAPQPCFTASNHAHTVAGRATQSGGNTFANGSGQAMGLWNTFVVHTLRQTGPNHYVIADGQC